MGGTETGVKVTGAQDSQEKGGKGDMLMEERVMPGTLRGEERERVVMGDMIIRKTDRALNKGEDMVVCFPGAKIEGGKNHGSRQGRINFSTRRD